MKLRDPQCLLGPRALVALILLGESLAGAGIDVDLGGIPARPVAPEFPFERFLQTRQLGQLAFGPDNRTLYFTRIDGRVQSVFAMDLETRSLRQVTHFEEPVARFLPGHREPFLILAQDARGNENFDLYRYDLGSGRRTRLTDAGSGDTTMLCGLSPDDRLLYYAQTRNHRHEAGLWQVGTDTGEARVLLPGNGQTYDCDGVSADGRYLLFGELFGFDERRLGLLDLVSGETRFIERTPGVNNVDAYFAGDQVYFRNARNADRFRLWRYRLGEAEPAPVDLPFDNDLDAFAMHAQGRVAVMRYRSALAGHTAIFVDGFETPETFGLPAEAIAGAVFSDSDPHLGMVSTETASSPRRYYLVGENGPELLYDANQSGIDSRLLAEARSILIPSFDGLQIPVHLFVPNGTSACTPRPALILIHGGPEEHTDPVYHSVVQFLANRGFVVVTPNVRGSTGFGKAFASLDDGDWGGAHIRDSVAVAGAVRRLDFIDGRNLFVAGESFGGFSVMSLITQYPDTFAAAVDLFGFTELATFVDSWPRYLRRHLFAELGFDPRIDLRRNWLLSPLYHVEQIRIPVQIHQGANDSRVLREQSDWLVRRLRDQGDGVEYFVYPDEGHGFTRAANESKAWQRVVHFLRAHMRPQVRSEQLVPGCSGAPRRAGQRRD
ncbi:MAG: alpha/beta fold hydrolase [Gammaproteobacteria bacterium]